MEKLLSISVAAYNVEQYLDKLIQSIVSSKYADCIEVLIVNDGSKDNTEAAGIRYEAMYPGIVRIITKENGGHGSTINRGILEATGRYFKALDGDDWLDTNSLDQLIQLLTKENFSPDAIVMDFWECYEDGRASRVRISGLKSGEIYHFCDIADQIERIKYHSVVFRTELLQNNGIKLDEKCFYVDTEYLLYTFALIDTVVYYDLPLYCYRLGITGQSVSRASRVKHIKDSETVSYSLLDFYKKRKDKTDMRVMNYIKKCIAVHMSWHIVSLLLMDDSKQSKSKIIAFDKDLKKAPEIYNSMNFKKYPVINMMRKSGYILYPIARLHIGRKIR